MLKISLNLRKVIAIAICFAGNTSMFAQVEVGVKIGETIWSTQNLGAANPEDEGNYYTWEEAKRACPDGWRLPTQEELASLVKSGSEWTTFNGKYGRKFGTGSKILFLPAAGFLNKNGVVSVGKIAYYWSNTPYDNFAYCLNFNHRIVFPADYFNRNSGGLSVRCVKIIK